ncbi:MAG: hypothetical protein HDR11_09660 [Lachnospiraceae bacterium]|nr:hypothetical protein [Lachnospiraceae bacterium]MBD5536903.1 hypothetical protein [Lachnospiraceae bacterium]
MNETEVAVKLEAHEHEIGSIKHRIRELEAENKALQELTISVNRLAVSVENMLTEVGQHDIRLNELEKVPIETNRQIKNNIISALVGGIITAVVAAVIAIL